MSTESEFDLTSNPSAECVLPESDSSVVDVLQESGLYTNTYISTSLARNILGVSDFALRKAKERGQVRWMKDAGGYRNLYSLEDIVAWREKLDERGYSGRPGVRQIMKIHKGERLWFEK